MVSSWALYHSLITTVWVWKFNYFSFTSLFIFPDYISSVCQWECYWRQCQNLTKFKTNNTRCFPLIRQTSHFTTEIYQFGQTWFPLHKWVLNSPKLWSIRRYIGAPFVDLHMYKKWKETWEKINSIYTHHTVINIRNLVLYFITQNHFVSRIQFQVRVFLSIVK